MINSNNLISTQQSVTCPGGTLYTIVSGDTLYLLARRFGTTVERLLAANPGINPNNLQIGQVICIPGTGGTIPGVCTGTLYTVRAGDTAFMIARTFGVTLEQLATANPGVNLSNLTIGQVLCIPTTVPGVCTGFLYTVRAGDTAFMIARTFGITLEQLATANPGVNLSNLAIGQVLCIPSTVPPVPTTTTCTFALNMSGLVPTLAPDAGGVVWIRRDATGRSEITGAISNVPAPSVFGASNYTMVFTVAGSTVLQLTLSQVAGNNNLWAGNTMTFMLPSTFFTNGSVSVFPGPVLVGSGNSCR